MARAKIVKSRSSVYLTTEVDEQLRQIETLCTERFGRRQGPTGGWRSYLIEQAIKRLDTEAFIAAELARHEIKTAA
jgi:hypothetical protein